MPSTTKYDHLGNIVDTGGATTVERDGITHLVFAPDQIGTQLLTRCGRRGTGELGHDTTAVDCPRCLGEYGPPPGLAALAGRLELVAEDLEPSSVHHVPYEAMVQAAADVRAAAELIRRMAAGDE
jgi:hypothetical protein